MLDLILAVLVCLVVLYSPGYILLRFLKIDYFPALAFAPVASCLLYTLLGVLLDKLALAVPAGVLFATALLFAVVCYGARFLLGGRTFKASELLVFTWDDLGKSTILKLSLIYVAVALFIVGVVYLSAVDTVYSFSRNDDTSVHISVVRAFLDTGYYSTLSASAYGDIGYPANFYPAQWYVTTCIVASVFNDSVMLAFNAMTVTFIGITFPLIMVVFLKAFFGSNRNVMLFGALFVVAFGGFPWAFIVFGQLFPNMMSFMFVPAAWVLCRVFVETSGKGNRALLAGLLCVFLASIVFSQPNGVFTWGLGAACFLVVFLLQGKTSTGYVLPWSRTKRFVCAGLFVVFAVVVWAAFYQAPFMERVVGCDYLEPFTTKRGALWSLFELKFTRRIGLQRILGIMVILGFVRTLVTKKHLGITLAYSLSAIIWVIDASTSGTLTHIVAGFWYNDYNRTGALVVMFALPLAIYGFSWLVEGVTSLIRKKNLVLQRRILLERIAVMGLSALMVLSLFLPNPPKPWTMNVPQSSLLKVRDYIQNRYSWDYILTSEERDFIKRVEEVIPDHALVINVGNDGSPWTYGAEGLNVLFRRVSTKGGATSEECEIIRTKLCDIATNKEVQEVVKELDAQYVLFLDAPDANEEDRTVDDFRYKAEEWVGVESITPETPGFELVLSEGDMRLYKILVTNE
jgi:hypothetical protein